LDAEKWCSVTRNEIRKASGGGLLGHYKGSLFRALTDLYPELILQKESFLSNKHWKAQALERQRNFLIHLRDPTIVEKFHTSKV